jgi:uncharacterized protein
MNRAILIHGWEETPEGQWLPWVAESLREKGWQVEVPEMPNTKTPDLSEWMSKLDSLSPDENTILVGHSLANALILKYLEREESNIKGAVMVAAWDWLLEDIKEFHHTFFETGFNYEKIAQKNTPLTIVNSTTDPYINYAKSQELASKVNAKFIGVEGAGHFMERDGFKQFPQLLNIIESI